MKGARTLFLVIAAMLLMLVAVACDTGGPPAQQPTATTSGERATATTESDRPTEEPTEEPTAEVDTGGWKTYTSEVGGFTVQMPGEAKESTETADSAVGELTFYNAVVDKGDIGYTAMYVDYPEIISQSDPAQLLDAAYGGVIGSNKEVSRETITVQGNSGITGEFEHPLGYAWYKATLQGTRLYQFIAIARDKDKEAANVQRFLNSVKLTRTIRATPTRAVVRATPTSDSGNTGDWQTVSSNEGEFSVEMPTEPRTSNQNTTAGGFELTLYTFESIQGRTEHTVVYVDYPQEAISTLPPEQLLKNAFGGVHGTNEVAVEEEITVQGNPGLYAEFNSTAGYAWYKAVVRGNRLYQLIAIAPDKAQGEADAKRFLDSFEITGGGGGGTTTAAAPGGGVVGERSGMTGLNKTLRVTINSIVHNDGKAEVLKPDAGNEYILLDITVENTGTQDESITPAFSRIEDSESLQHNPTYGPHVKNFLNGSIAPGAKLRGMMGYEVPVSATGLTWVYDPPLEDNTLRFALDR